MHHRNGFLFLERFAEKLIFAHKNECRFDAYYLLKKALFEIVKLKSNV
jgi:hypothetical protein